MVTFAVTAATASRGAVIGIVPHVSILHGAAKKRILLCFEYLQKDIISQNAPLLLIFKIPPGWSCETVVFATDEFDCDSSTHVFGGGVATRFVKSAFSNARS